MQQELRARPPYIEALRPHIEQAIAWLQGKQDPEGILIHHGIHLDAELSPEFIVSFAPVAAKERPVFVFERRRKQWTDGYGRLLNPITEAEFECLKQLISEVRSVFDSWNGVGSYTGSISIEDRAGPGVLQVLRNYRKGCHDPEHGHLVSSVFCEKGWYKAGRAKVIIPEGWY